MYRKFRSPFERKERRRGFTLMETVITVGIIVIICGIAIPSIISAKNALDAKKRDNYAKSIYLAAQTNLTLLHSTGDLANLHTLSGVTPHAVPTTDNADFPESKTTGYYYVTSASADTGIFNRLLPAGSIDGTIRSRQILIEYNPATANVYSVFYSEGDSVLSYDSIARDSAARKRLKVGYYDGRRGVSSSSGVIGSDDAPEQQKSSSELKFDNATGIVTLTVPLPSNYASLGLTPTLYLDNLDVELSIVGELSNARLEAVDLKDTTNHRVDDPVPGGTDCTFTYTLDSLEIPALSFSEFESSGFLLGENVTLSASCTYNPTDDQLGLIDVKISDAVLRKVNPLYAGNTGTTITVANARNLQNLNLYEAGESIRLVEITSNIVWNSSLNFAPISNPMLFGSAEFYTIEDANDSTWQDAQDAHPNREIRSGAVVLTDVTDTDTHARIKGGNHTISGLKIANDASRDFTGLFAYTNARIDGLTVTGADVSGSGSATGILVGAVGCKASVVNCTVTDSTLSASAAAAGDSYVGGVAGYAAESAVESTLAVGLTVTVSGSTAQSCVGGLVGAVDGGSVKDSSVSGSLTMSDGAAGCVGGAVGAEHDGAAFESVSAAVDLSGWGGTAGTATPNSPSGYNVKVGKFVGSVESGEYTNCTGTGSSEGREYHFLGYIECEAQEYTFPTQGRIYQLDAPSFDVNQPNIPQTSVSLYRSDLKTLSDSNVSLCKYYAKLDNCTFLNASGTRYKQVLVGCGYYQEYTWAKSVSNQKLTPGNRYILMSYDGSKIMYADEKTGFPPQTRATPKYETTDSKVTSSGTVYLDPSLLEDLDKYTWTITTEPGTAKQLNLRNLETEEYLAFNHSRFADSITDSWSKLVNAFYMLFGRDAPLPSIPPADPFMSTGYKVSSDLRDLRDDPDVALLYVENLLYPDPPEWTYLADADGCFWFAQCSQVDRLITDSYLTVCLSFSGSNQIGRKMTLATDTDALIARLIFNDKEYRVPKDDSCKFRVVEVGNADGYYTTLTENTQFDFLEANCLIGAERMS